MKIIQIFTVILSATAIFCLIGLSYCIWETREWGVRFEKTKLNISTAELRTIWG